MKNSCRKNSEYPTLKQAMCWKYDWYVCPSTNHSVVSCKRHGCLKKKHTGYRMCSLSSLFPPPTNPHPQSQAVPENKRKESTIKGICMGRTNRGPRSTFRIRNHINLVGTFERTFPVYSPHIKSIKVVESRKVNRTKLYYLRDKPIKEYKV